MSDQDKCSNRKLQPSLLLVLYESLYLNDTHSSGDFPGTVSGSWMGCGVDRQESATTSDTVVAGGRLPAPSMVSLDKNFNTTLHVISLILIKHNSLVITFSGCYHKDAFWEALGSLDMHLRHEQVCKAEACDAVMHEHTDHRAHTTLGASPTDVERGCLPSTRKMNIKCSVLYGCHEKMQ